MANSPTMRIFTAMPRHGKILKNLHPWLKKELDDERAKVREITEKNLAENGKKDLKRKSSSLVDQNESLQNQVGEFNRTATFLVIVQGRQGQEAKRR